MTIFRLYAANGDRAGFWVQHRSWPNMCAQVLSIGGRRAGRLPGKPPLYNHAEVIVRGFDVRSGRPIELGPVLESPEDAHFAFIAEPSWHHGMDNFAEPPVQAAGRAMRCSG
jgi:hypothetical protein